LLPPWISLRKKKKETVVSKKTNQYPTTMNFKPIPSTAFHASHFALSLMLKIPGRPADCHKQYESIKRQSEEKNVDFNKAILLIKKLIRGKPSDHWSKELTGVHWSNSGLLEEPIENKFVLICCIFWQCLGFLSVLLKFLLQRPAQFVTT